MWQLTELQATNICAFESLHYHLAQNQATLIFGNNLDSDSQNSNGSGKSALIEALAIGILGEPLRKVNVDEIINDNFDEAQVEIVLKNTELRSQMTITRKLSRKSPQEIVINMNKDGQEDVVKQSSVLDYNRFVFGELGLTKDDILHNFILTARKYQSFLSSSDKDKKEIINRFSNGIMVDESIEALHSDMGPLQASLREAENEVAKCSGRVSALAEEIERIINDEANNKLSIQERIENLQEAISQKRAKIRQFKQEQVNANVLLDNLDAFDQDMQELEKSDADISKAYSIINTRLTRMKVTTISNYDEKIKDAQKSCEELTEEVARLNNEAKAFEQKEMALEKELQEIDARNQQEFANIDSQTKKLDDEIKSLRQQVSQLKEQSAELTNMRGVAYKSIALLEQRLAGVIKCPLCHHEFTLAEDMDIKETRAQLAQQKKMLASIESDIRASDIQYSYCVKEGKAKASEQTEIINKKQPLVQAYGDAKVKLIAAQNNLRSIECDCGSAQRKLQSVQESIAGMRKQMFDEVFNLIDATINNQEYNLDGIETCIKKSESAIETYEEQIQQLRNGGVNNELERIKESKAKYEQDWKKAEENKELVAAQLDTLKVQEATFVEFKTYLANTKINAIAQITNDFLEAIGSDIRVNLSGYTILKSGKVRDKISASLIRNGMDCGSFDKFSAGEKCRVELANVLAMHKLSNINCETGKGLNLLVIDEILDCTDETGLANVFKALNDTQITSLVVSHGNIAENYPNRLVVTKQNGISTINEVSKH